MKLVITENPSVARTVAAVLGAPTWLQLVLFVLISGLCFAFLYPRLKRFVGRNRQATNADMVLGQICVVVRRIDNIAGTGAVSVEPLPAGYMNAMTSWQDILSGFGWGLGYFGMPHIIIRFMSLKSQKELKKSAGIGITWTVLIIAFAVIAGCVGRQFLGFDQNIADNSLVFISMVRKIFPALISGILLSAVLAALRAAAERAASGKSSPCCWHLCW